MLLTADRVVLADGKAHAKIGIRIDGTGAIRQVGPLEQLGRPSRILKNRVLMPGFVNAHSHAFQRLLRGRTQVAGPAGDNFWTWRDKMYQAAHGLDAQGVYVASRQAFLEMLLAGVTTVGEFHYLHHQPDGRPYADSSVLADAVVRAARSVGIRLCLLRVVYLRGDFDAAPSPLQVRFCDASVDEAITRIDAVQQRMLAYRDARLSFGVAAHSVRALEPEAILALKVRFGHQPFHIHVSEQQKEVEGCKAAYGVAPVALLARFGVLDSMTTLVHATHVSEQEIQAIAAAGSVVCMCPSTEADLGDGLGPARQFFEQGVPICLGSDGQTQTSIVAEARRVEMHERLRLGQRNVLCQRRGDHSALSVFRMATENGARSLGLQVGRLANDTWADLIALNLNDPALAGWSDASLLASVMFSADSRAVSDVMVHGRWVVESGQHREARTSARDFREVSQSLMGSSL